MAYFTRKMNVAVRSLYLRLNPQTNSQNATVELASNDQALFIVRNPEPVLGNRFIGVAIGEGKRKGEQHQPFRNEQPPHHKLAPQTKSQQTRPKPPPLLPQHLRYEKSKQKEALLKSHKEVLQNQLAMHKKIFAMMKDEKEKQSKLKEILICQKKINVLAQQMLQLIADDVEEQSKMDAETTNAEKGHADNKGHVAPPRKSFTLDKRTTVLKIADPPKEADEESLRRHFTPFGNLSSVKVCEDGTVIVAFATRISAERAKANGSLFNNEAALKLEWHKERKKNVPVSETAQTDDAIESNDGQQATWKPQKLPTQEEDEEEKDDEVERWR